MVIQFGHRVGNACLSREFVNLHCDSFFLVGSGKEFDGFNTFSKSKDACIFCINFLVQVE